jgi:hypothetical protein
MKDRKVVPIVLSPTQMKERARRILITQQTIEKIDEYIISNEN